MEGMADISRILGIIMENPEIIEKIRQMAQTDDTSETEIETSASPAPQEAQPAENEEKETDSPKASAPPREYDKKRRHDLLCAITPYVSPQRSRAIDTMLSVVEVFEIMKAR